MAAVLISLEAIAELKPAASSGSGYPGIFCQMNPLVVLLAVVSVLPAQGIKDLADS